MPKKKTTNQTKQQQQQKNLLAEIFCIFECLLTQNPTNQGSQLSILPGHMKDY